MIHDDLLRTIGHTPLVRLRKVVPEGCAEVVVKLEFFAPGGSIKDRAALAMIDDAERRGVLRPGATVVEASAGNTGVGLAMVCAVRGYRCIIVLPDGTSREKRAVLAAFGAELVIARNDVEGWDAEGYIGRASQLAKELGAFNPDQFENSSNPGAHYTTTGPEIVAACDGKLDAFVACVGSGGTLGGTSRYLRQHVPGIVIYGAAPDHAGCAGAHGGTLVEGIVEDIASCEGQGATPDEIVRVHDRDAVAMTLRLAREEAILGGGSGGVAVCAAIEVARRLGSSKRIVTVVPDTGRNYLSTYFDSEWRRARDRWRARAAHEPHTGRARE